MPIRGSEKWRLCVGWAASLLLVATSVFAQRTTAAIRGKVTDPSRAVIAAAPVRLRNEETGLVRTAETNAAGNFVFSDLPVGRYAVEVAVAGFRSEARTHVILGVADVREVNVELVTGEMAETVSVEAPALAVKTVGAEMAGLIGGDEARELPLNGRNFLQLALLQPGVTPTEGLDTVNKGLLGGADVSVSGGSTTSNMWLLDGADNVDHGSNRTLLIYPSIDAIEEFKIERNNYGAEFGQAGGAQINVVTRGGTNTFHGGAYYFARRDSWNATDYFLKRSGLPPAPLQWDDFGGTFGGRIVRDKLHFFVSYEQNKDDRSDVRSGFVPTGAERAGDFSGAPIDGCTPPAPVDPLTGKPFPGNIIPADRLDPAGLALVQLYELPTRTPPPGDCTNYVRAVATPIHWSQISARVDWNIDHRTRAMVRYTQDSWKADNSLLGIDSPLSVIGSNWDQPGRSLVAQLNRTLGANMSNTLTFSYSGNAITVTRAGDSSLIDEINTLIPTLYPASVKENGGASQPVYWGSAGLFNQAPWKNNQDLFVLKDDFAAVFGQHFLKAGLHLGTNAKNEDASFGGSAESVQIGGAVGTVGPTAFIPGATSGNSIADLLLRGTVYDTSELKTNKNVPQRWRDLELYVADSYKVSPRVTADLGFRFSHLETPWMADDQQANFVPSTVDPALGNSPCNGMVYPRGADPCPGLGLAGGTEAAGRTLVPTRFLWAAPRLGVAWNVSGDGKTALRGGLGLFYARERVNTALQLGVNPPISGTAAVTRTLASNEPVAGDAAPEFGAPGIAHETTPSNVHYWQWNATFERELFRNTLLEAAYVGSKGLDLLGQTNLNEVPPENRAAYARTGAAALRPLDGITGVGNGDLFLWQHDRNSIYHGLQVALNSRFGRGSVLAVAYTWSKLITTGAADDASGGGNGWIAYRDSTAPELERARGGTDRTHSFNARLVLLLPRFQSRSSFVRHLAGDWEFTTIVQAASGYPVTVSAWVSGLSGPAGTGGVLQTPKRVTSRPCRVKGANDLQWLDPAAFTLDGFAIGTNGDSGRGVCSGPGLFQADASLYKNIGLGSKVKVQLRLEMFNVFDTVNFLGYSLNTGYDAQNVVFDTGDPATATKIVRAAPPGGFGQFTAAGSPRTMQVGIRFMF